MPYNRTSGKEQVREIDSEKMKKMKAEALVRLSKLGLSKNDVSIIDEFDKGKVYVSDNDMHNTKDILREATEKEKKMIDSIQKRTGNLVYHVVRTANLNGTHNYYFMFVHCEEHRWELQNMQLELIRNQIRPVVIVIDAMYNGINDDINAEMFYYKEMAGYRAYNGLTLEYNEIPITTRPEYYG